MSAAFHNEPGDIFMYSTSEQESREPSVYVMLEDLAGRVVEDAEKTVMRVRDKLAPVMLPPQIVEPTIATENVQQEAWPPHFSTMRDRLHKVEDAMAEIRQLVESTGL